MSDIMSYLFATDAIRICEENKPFWYTSGKIGPYFINTHFVYGNEKDACYWQTSLYTCSSVLDHQNTLAEQTVGFVDSLVGDVGCGLVFDQLVAICPWQTIQSIEVISFEVNVIQQNLMGEVSGIEQFAGFTVVLIKDFIVIHQAAKSGASIKDRCTLQPSAGIGVH